ncbi:flagellar type III secretion system pore protein FliP [Stratiformator vulcanicus]|uniref:flagellar type III secretion system pore protein FliP n=1 Tax=Stratiformator vulcanicus TaxID=2527980 RepID=UPI002877CFAD|nr:flagellar type III secretion system pore protein FliP [Stratiformator vulcanicus]
MSKPLRAVGVVAISALLFAALTSGASAQSFLSEPATTEALPIGPIAEFAQPPLDSPDDPVSPRSALTDVEGMLSPQGMSSTLKVITLLTVLSLAPSILIMTTCFIRFIVVLGLLRQALGTQQLPPNQVIISLCLFLTIMVMAPVWKQAYEEGIQPYTSPAPGVAQPTLEEAFTATVRPLRRFMAEQIELTGNSDTVWMFLEFQQGSLDETAEMPQGYDELPLSVLLPAYMMSELKTAFVIGFQVYLPFLVIDMVIASVLISMGMMMLPPVLISLPFKILLFVLIDGWFLTIGMLLESVRPFG